MPWFKIDDSAHTHPKWVRAGNAALGLWVRCGSYSAQHLTEGIIPGEIARLYGTPPQVAKLVKVGLWHEAGHTCSHCPQPGDDEYVFHDFFEGGRNTTRAQAEAAKDAAAERQRKHRAKRNAEVFADESNPNRGRNEEESSAKTIRKDPPFRDSDAGQGGLSQRYDRDGVTPPQASYQASTSEGSTSLPEKPARAQAPVPDVIWSGESQPEHVPTCSGSAEIPEWAATGGSAEIPERAPTRSQSVPIPEWATPLVHRIHAAGLPGLRWNLASADWLMVDALMKAKGIDAMADYAARAAESSAKPVVSARYFIAGWKELPNPPPDGTAAPVLRAIPGPTNRQPRPGTDTKVAGWGAVAAELAAQEDR